jgi:hypothetical protein
MRPPAFFASIPLASLALLAGCAGTNVVQQPFAAGQSAATLRAAAQAIVLKPTSLTFGLSRSRPTLVAITGGTPPYSVRQSNPDIADVSQPRRSARTWAFYVAAAASGTTIVTVRDASGATTALSVNQQPCVPPTPEFGQIYPRSGATNVPRNAGVVYVAEPSSDPLRPYVHQFYARLVGSDGSVADGRNFQMTRATPPPGSAPEPPSSVLVRAAIPILRSGVTYRLLYPTKRQPCIGPLSTGSFTT